MQSSKSALKSSATPESVRYAGPIRPGPFAGASAATTFLPVAVILSVGVDLPLSGSQSRAWQSARYHVTPAESMRDAIDHIRYGDFDLVLIGDSVRPADRERLAFLIRALGSRVPVVYVTDSSSDCADFADATARSEPNPLLQCIGKLLAAQAGQPAARPISRVDC